VLGASVGVYEDESVLSLQYKHTLSLSLSISYTPFLNLSLLILSDSLLSEGEADRCITVPTDTDGRDANIHLSLLTSPTLSC